jgi:hypothetical protein
MILGRTPAGAIKTKTDGGLRAVNCACCGTCGCGTVRLPSHLFETLKNATSATVWGTNLDEFIPNPAPPSDFLWEMRWLGGQVPDIPYTYYTYRLGLQKNGCLFFAALYSCPSEAAAYTSLAGFGSPDGCVQPEVPFGLGTFSINGEGEFSYYYEPYVADICDPPGPPNLIIT